MSTNQITLEEVRKIAELSKLDISGDEERFTTLFNDTLLKIDTLDELDTSKVAESFQVTGLINVFQDQNTQQEHVSFSPEEVLQNVPLQERGLVETKGVFER